MADNVQDPVGGQGGRSGGAGPGRDFTVPALSPLDYVKLRSEVRNGDSPPAVDSREELQQIIQKAKSTGLLPPATIYFSINDVTVSVDLPPTGIEFPKVEKTIKKAISKPGQVPKTEFIGPLNLIGPRLPTAEDALAGTAGIVASQGSPMTEAQRERYFALRKAQVDAAKAVADKEAQREADRVALEQLRLQKESELIQYKNDYFASPQIGIYIGDRWVGNAVTIEFTENVSKAPLYGYASTHFDAVAKGNVIVQGQLSIAYTGENYLASILRNYKSTEGVGDSVPFAVKDPVERAKKLFWNLENIHEPVLTKPLEYGYHGGKTGAVGTGFNIRVFYGSQNFLIDSFKGSSELKFSGPVQTIVNVHLTSRSIVMQPTGDPIGETYTFFARSITTGVQRNSINPNRIIRSRDAQNTPIATTTGTTPTGLRNEPAQGPA